KTSANLQYARALARTSERVCVLYADESGEVKSDSLKYLNRLSDYLFVMARYANLLEGVADVKSKPARPRRRPKK
ncbi:ATP:cob(I)alamin adenosyltransferase, partial [Lactobacillus delbrueckii]